MLRDEDDIEREREQLRLAVEATGLGTWDYDPRTDALAWDERARTLLGLGPSESPGGLEDFLERVHPEDRGPTEAALRRALRPGGSGHYSREYRILASSEVRWVAANGRTFHDAAGQPVRFLGTLVDITERVRGRGAAERERTERERLLREHERAVEVLQHGDAVFVLDKDFRLVLVNENQERLSRTRREDTLGRVFWDVFPATARPDSRYWVEYHRVMEQRVPTQFDEYYAPLDLWTSVSAYPTREGGISVFFRDVTEQKRAEQFRERLLGIVGHDLRNPLGNITLTAQLLLRREEVPEPVRAGVRRIATSAHRMTRMIDDLLDFTRASVGGGLPVSRRPTDLCELVDATVAEFELTHPGRVRLMCARGLHGGEWDRDRLAQVVSNLVGNALTHGDEASPVTVAVRAEPPDVVLSVHNEGPPIPAELLPRIFDPFKRAGTDGGRRGLGLGLYIVQQIVLAHGGSISAESSEAGGTTFSVRLPREPPREDTAPAQPG
jgi:PAS domain S-box-containing protein